MFRGAVLYAKDLETLVRFYSALGGELSESVASEFAVIGKGGFELIILQAPDHISANIVIEKPPVIRTSNPFKAIIQVSTMALALKAAIEHGGMIVPGSKQWQFRNYMVQDIVDPEGNVVQLWQLK